MADRVEQFTVTVSAGTPIAAPQETALKLTPADVERVDIYIPAGHAGLTGFRLAVAHSPILPANTGAYIVGEDERLTYPLEDFPDSGQWSIFAYNLDVFPHAFYLTFLLKVVRHDYVVIGGPTPYVAPVDTNSLGSAPYVTEVPETPLPPVETPTPDPLPEPEPLPDTGDGGTGDDGGQVDAGGPLTPPDDGSNDEIPPVVPDPVIDTTPDPIPEPVPVPSAPAPPPPPQSKYAEYYGWQSDGQVVLYHWYVDGPRAPQLVPLRVTGSYGKPPKTLSKSLADQGWYASATALPLGGKAVYQKFLGFGFSD